MRLRLLRLPVLLIVLLLVAACNGPTSIETHEDAEGPYEIKVEMDPPQLQAGQKATLNYQFTDRATNGPVVDLPPLHGTAVHSILVNRQLNWFQHGYTAFPTGGWYPVQLRFDEPGHYKIWTLFAGGHDGEEGHFEQEIAFGPGAFEPAHEGAAPLNEERSFNKLVYGVDVTLETANLHVGQPAELRYSFAVKGEPVTDLSPFLDAGGHLFIISADLEHFAHEVTLPGIGTVGDEPTLPSEGGGQGSTGGGPQPNETPEGTGGEESTPVSAGTMTPGMGPEPRVSPAAEATAPPTGVVRLGPTLTFKHTFEHPGLYKVFAEFLYQNNILTPQFVIRVEP